jgi:hypothetical protein
MIGARMSATKPALSVTISDLQGNTQWDAEKGEPIWSAAEKDEFRVTRNTGVCRECHERPEGCWRAKTYGCTLDYQKAARQAAETGNCPVKKLNK